MANSAPSSSQLVSSEQPAAPGVTRTTPNPHSADPHFQGIPLPKVSAATEDTWSLVGITPDWWPQAILAHPELADFLCPLTGCLMEDPVTAEDGFVYERQAIELWFNSNKTSPKTSKDMGRKLTTNESVRKAICQLKSSKHAKKGIEWDARGQQTNPRSLPQSALAEILTTRSVESRGSAPRVSVMSATLSKFFTGLDPLRDLLYSVLDGWCPPKIIVIGDECSGKSTILEQLGMLPVFPRNDNFCTRLAIQVRLRRSPGQHNQAMLKVVNKQTGAVDGTPQVIPLERGFDYVHDAMNKLVEAQNVEGIIEDKSIVLELPHPDVPSLDLIDLPGLTQYPEKKRTAIEGVLKQQVEADKHAGGHDLYLAVVPASERPCASSAMRFISDNNLSDRTIGVFSKCDDVPDHRFSILKSRITGEPTEDGNTAESMGAVPLKKGWITTMLEPPADKYYNTHQYERLWVQHGAEVNFFKKDHPVLHELNQMNVTGICALVKLLEKEYAAFLQTTWKDRTMRKILEKEEETQFKLRMLGAVDNSKKEKTKLAALEVERRLGPDSSMTELYLSFLSSVLEVKLRKRVNDAMGSIFGSLGQSWKSQDVSANVTKIKNAVSAIVMDVSKEATKFFMPEITRVVTAEIKVNEQSKDEISIGATSIFARFVNLLPAMPKRQAYKEVQNLSLFHLCNYPDYTDTILSACSKLFQKASSEVEKNTQCAIEKFGAPDSPWLVRKPVNNCTEVTVECKTEEFVNVLVVEFLERVPSPQVLKDVHIGLDVGKEGQTAIQHRTALEDEKRKIEAARDGICKVFSIGKEELERLRGSLDSGDSASPEDPKSV